MVKNSKIQKPVKKTFGQGHDALKALHQMPHGMKKPHQPNGHAPMRRMTAQMVRGK